MVELSNRQICKQRRNYRQEIAKANGIKYLEGKCNNLNCVGVYACSVCTEESLYLEFKLNELVKQGKQIVLVETPIKSIGSKSSSRKWPSKDCKDFLDM